MTIDPNDPRITAYVFGELSDADRADFEAQLEGSSELRALVAQTRKAVALLESEIQSAPQAQLLPPQRDAVTAGIHGQAAPPRPAPPIKGGPRHRLPGWVVGSLAGSVLLLLGVGAWMSLRVSYQTSVVVSTAPTASYREDAVSSIEPSSERSRELSSNGGGERANKLEQMAELHDLLVDSASEAPAGDLPPAPMDPQAPKVAVELEPSLSLAPLASASAPHPFGGKRIEQREANEPVGELIRGRPDRGEGPGRGGDKFDPITENAFQRALDQPLSTFSIDVDTASYSKVRMFLEQGQMPRPAAVRLEEMINYFNYGYEPPPEDGDTPFAAHLAVTECPWAPSHRLVRIALKGREFETQRRPDANLVFLIDVSGSMNQPNKLPLLKRGMKMLASHLGEDDRVAIVVYAGAAGLALDSTPGSQQGKILATLDRLKAGGSTNGGEGIHLAYRTALDHFIEDGVNRVILCSDGDFNVGTSGTDELVEMAAEKAKTGVFLSVLGFGMGNHNDAMMEQVSNRGNGNYAFIDNDAESAKVLVEQMDSTLVTIAKDVKVQVEFNPARVEAYRMLGYENRRLAAQDFDDDKKDAGEIGAGHTVTMLYEIVPVGAESDAQLPPDGRGLKYLKPAKPSDAADSDELLTVWMRYKQPDADTSTKLEFPLKDKLLKFGEADRDFRFAAAVASFGMLLRDSEHRGDASYDAVLEIAAEAAGKDPLRLEMLQLVRQAKALSGL